MSFKRKNKTILHILLAILAVIAIAAYMLLSGLEDDVYVTQTTKRYQLNAKF